MPEYVYKVRTAAGKILTGVITGANEDEVIFKLQDKGFVLSVKPTKRLETERVYKVKLHNRIKGKDIIIFANQLATTLKANIPILKALDIQIEQTTSRRLKHVLRKIQDDIRGGNSLEVSLSKHPRVFDGMWINLVSAGEASGKLPEILFQLGRYLQARAELRRKVITAFIYPTILIIAALIAVYIFNIIVIPIFAGIFKEFNVELPLITKLVIGVSSFMKNNKLLIFGGVLLAVLVLWRFIKTDRGREVFDRLVFKIPIFGPFIHNICIERFSSCLALLLESGITILEGIDIVSRVSNNKVFEKVLMKVKEEVKEGRSFSDSLKQKNIFPPIVVNMCAVGEEVGELGKMLHEVTAFYREELATFVERLGAILEPVVILFMGGIIFVIVLALYLPIFNIALLGGR